MIWFVQGATRLERELWDAGEIVGGLVPAGSLFAFLAEHRCEVFDGEFIADLFPAVTGRPSLPADLVGSVLVLKELYDLSDRQTAEALMFDIRWKVACGRSLTQMSFDPSTLVYWRRRIAASARPDRVFDKVAQIIAETGLLRGRRRRCVDSTIFDDAVATQDTVTQLVAAMRKVARLVGGADAVIAAVCVLDYAKAGKPDIDWDDPDAKAALVSSLVNDALAVLAALTGPDAPVREPAEADALGLLALVAGQDVEPADGSDGTDGRWVIARKVAPDRVISTVDRQARHARKSRSQRKDGYRAHLAAEPQTGLITDAKMTMATGADNTDAAVGVKMANRDRFRHAEPSTAEPSTAEGAVSSPEPQAADTEAADDTDTVVNKDTIVDAEPAVGAALNPEPADTDTVTDAEPAADATVVDAEPAADATVVDAEPAADTVVTDAEPADVAPAVVAPGSCAGHDCGEDGQDAAGGLEIYGDSAYGSGEARAAYLAGGHDVVIKPKPLTAAVPGGFTLDDFDVDEGDATVTCPAGHTRPMSPARVVSFGRLCQGCPLRARCTTAKDGRSMTIHKHDDLLRAARVQAKTAQYKQDYPTRSNVERAVAHVATQNGRRIKLRYLGVAKNNAWLRTRCAALNLRSLLRHGLTWANGTWATA